jgi:hypothetical protein
MKLEQLIQNPRGMALKKFMFDILKDKYGQHDDLLDRIASFLVTERDLVAYSKLISDVHEVGYLKAVADYKEQLADMGIGVTVGKKTQE